MKKTQIVLEDVLIAIRAYCLECSGGSKKEVENCRISTCRLYPYRCISALEYVKPAEQAENQITIFECLEKNASCRKKTG